MKYGVELVQMLKNDIQRYKEQQENRQKRIDSWETDIDDCFISDRVETRGISNAKEKIDLIENGGCMWFTEYATLDGILVDARWCNCNNPHGFGTVSKLRVEMPDGTVIWTAADTAAGLKKRGLKKVLCKRPAWFRFSSSERGMMGVYSGSYIPFPSDVNYATGEAADTKPVEIKEIEE